MVDVPRILILAPEPAAPLPFVTAIPGTELDSNSCTFVTGCDLRTSSVLTVPIEPVRFTFFCVPKPTTTTSSSACESSFRIIFILF